MIGQIPLQPEPIRELDEGEQALMDGWMDDGLRRSGCDGGVSGPGERLPADRRGSPSG